MIQNLPNVINLFPDSTHTANVKEGTVLKYLVSELRKDNLYNNWFEIIELWEDAPKPHITQTYPYLVPC